MSWIRMIAAIVAIVGICKVSFAQVDSITKIDSIQFQEKLDSTKKVVKSLLKEKVDSTVSIVTDSTKASIDTVIKDTTNQPSYYKYLVKEDTNKAFDKAPQPISIGYPSNQYYYKWENDTFNPYNFKPAEFYENYNLYLVDSLHPAFVFPLDNELKITSKFGWRRYRYHHGIDLDLETGDPVRTCWDGKVRFAKFYAGYGNVVVVRHYNGLETVYAHLNAFTCQINQEVKAGQIIGLGGNTGRSTGSHLHFEIKFRGKSIDPTKIIDFQSKSMWAVNYPLSKASFGHHIEITSIKYHTIRKGDTLGGIAGKYRTSIGRLCSLNRISRNTTLRIGRRLRVR